MNIDGFDKPRFMRPEDYEMKREVENPKPKFMRPEDYEMKAEVERIQNLRNNENKVNPNALETEITLDYKDIKEITALNPNPLVKEKLSEWQDEAEKTIQKLASRDEHIK